jgi:hypothetical protein
LEKRLKEEKEREKK